METIGDRVRRLREASGIERKDLARDVGLSYSGLSDLESGKAKSSTKLHRLAEALGVSTTYLETGKEPRGEDAQLAFSRRSQPLRLNPTMLAETHRALRKLEHAEGRKFSLEDEKYAARFVQLYEIRAAMSAKPTQDEWVEFGQKLAAIMTPTGGDDGRGGGVPAHGTGAKKVAEGLRRKG